MVNTTELRAESEQSFYNQFPVSFPLKTLLPWVYLQTVYIVNIFC